MIKLDLGNNKLFGEDVRLFLKKPIFPLFRFRHIRIEKAICHPADIVENPGWTATDQNPQTEKCTNMVVPHSNLQTNGSLGLLNAMVGLLLELATYQHFTGKVSTS